MAPGDKSDVVLECLDANGDAVARLRLREARNDDDLEEKNPPALIVIDEATASRDGLSCVQLRESCSYRYSITDLMDNEDKSLSLDSNPLINKSKDLKLIQTKASAGHLTIRLIDEEGNLKASCGVEIRSVKLNYLDEYRGMIRGLAKEVCDYIYDLGAATEVPLSSKWSKDPPMIHQQVEYLRATLGSRSFRSAITRILRSPHEKLTHEPERHSVLRHFKSGRSIQSELSRGGGRIAVPEAHPLYARMRSYGIANPSLPESITVASKKRTLDTPENRFIKHVLKDFSAFLDHARDLLEATDKEKKYGPVLRDIKGLTASVSRYLQSGMFHEISDPKMLPLGSPVLQKKAGYREILQQWMQFKMSAKVNWAGSDAVYGGADTKYQAGKKDLPALYEAWLFFKLLRMFESKFQLDNRDKQKLIHVSDVLTVNLRHGLHAKFNGLLMKGGRKLNGQFHYNRSFDYQPNPPEAGSWTRVLRPDYTMTFWPGDMSVEDAERHELAVHVHFDAKYRVQSIDKLFGKEALPREELDKEKAGERDGNYNRGDLLKMHAYRDAIRRSEGAFVLYPGSFNEGLENKRWEGFHEYLPGLGAFAVRPDEEGGAVGLAALSDFLDQVLNQLANRASYLEQQRQGSWRVMETQREWRDVYGTNKSEVWDPLVDHLNPGSNIPDSAHEIMVVIGWCKDGDHLRWIEENGLYNFRIGTGVHGDIEQVDPCFAEARMIVLHDGSGVLPGVWRVKRTGVQFMTKGELPGKGHNATHEKYAVFSVEQLPHYKTLRWDKAAVSLIKPQLNDPILQGVPIVLSLAEFLRASPMTPVSAGYV